MLKTLSNFASMHTQYPMRRGYEEGIMELSLPGTFAPMERNYPGTFAPKMPTAVRH